MDYKYNDPIDRANDYYQESLDGEMCPMCGGCGRIPEPDCIDDCECTECYGNGYVSRLQAKQIRKQLKQMDYGD